MNPHTYFYSPLICPQFYHQPLLQVQTSFQPQLYTCAYTNSLNSQYQNFPGSFPYTQDPYYQQQIPQPIIHEQIYSQRTKRIIESFSENLNDPKEKEESSNLLSIKNLTQILDGVFIRNEGMVEIEKISKQSHHYQLPEIIQNLVKKQNNQEKSREELVKYTLRRAIRFVVIQIKNEDQTKKMNLKEAQRVFNKKILGQEDNDILPFRKNSKIKTMNSQFLFQIFRSQEFCYHYSKFLDAFEEIIEKDNAKKIEQLSSKLLIFIFSTNNNEFDFSRVPWSKNNINRLISVSHELWSYTKINGNDEKIFENIIKQ